MNKENEKQAPSPAVFLLYLSALAFLLLGAGFVMYEMENRPSTGKVGTREVTAAKVPSKIPPTQKYPGDVSDFNLIDFSNGLDQMHWGMTRKELESVIQYPVTSTTEKLITVQVPIQEKALPLSLNFTNDRFSSMTFISIFPNIPDMLPGSPQKLVFDSLVERADRVVTSEKDQKVYHLGNSKMIKISFGITLPVTKLYQNIVIISPQEEADEEMDSR